MKFDLLVQSVLFPVGLILFQKQLRFRETELIDTLLHISDHKHIRGSKPLSGDTADQRLLYLVAVLILVHQDLLENFRKLVRHRSRSVVQTASGEDFQGKMLQIVKVHQILLFLRLLKSRGKLLRKLQKHSDRFSAGIHIGKYGIRVSRKIPCFHLLDPVLCEVPVRCRLLFLFRVRIFPPDCRQSSKFQISQTLRKLLVSSGFLKCFHPPDIFR